MFRIYRGSQVIDYFMTVIYVLKIAYNIFKYFRINKNNFKMRQVCRYIL